MLNWGFSLVLGVLQTQSVPWQTQGWLSGLVLPDPGFFSKFALRPLILIDLQSLFAYCHFN